MMHEKMVEFTTNDETRARLTLRDTLRHDIRFAVMQPRFAGDEHPDQGFRFDFCWLVARVTAVEGLGGWQPVDETATPDEFTACYHAFAERVDRTTFYDLVAVVNAFKQPVADAVEKPEAALTPPEAADPN